MIFCYSELIAYTDGAPMMSAQDEEEGDMISEAEE